MKTKALLWMLVSYATLGLCLFWSARQSSGYLAGIVFLTSLAFSWLPLYVYWKRQDIKANKAYWVSQGAALLITAVVAMLIFSFEPDTQLSSEFSSWVHSLVIYVLLPNSIGVVLAMLFRSVENRVEKKMLPPQTTEGSKSH